MTASPVGGVDGEAVLVTGGSGFIGTNLINDLSGRAGRLLNLDVRFPLDPAQAEHWQACDILDRDALEGAFRTFRPDLVIHLAARTDLHGAHAEEYGANIQGVRNVIRAVAAVGGVRLTMYASSRLVFDIHHRPAHDYDYHPTTPYGASKVLGEEIVRNEAEGASPWVLMRPTSIWGPWFDIPYKSFFDSVLAGRYVHPRGRRVFKSYGYVKNVVHEITQLAKADSAVRGKVFWLADYDPLEVGLWAGVIRRESGLSHVRSVPVWTLRCGAWAGDLARRFGMAEPPLTSFRLDNLLTQMVYDVSDLRRVVGDLPYGLEGGTQETLRWMSSRRAPRAG